MSLVLSAWLVATLRSLAPVEGDLTLRWDAPAECPDADAVRTAFEHHAQLGHASVEVSGTVSREGSLYVLELTLSGPGGRETRRIEADSCDALADTAGLLGAVASEPALAPTFVPEPEAPGPAPEPEKPEKPEKPETPEPMAPERGLPAPVPAKPPEPTSASIPVQLIVRAEGLVQGLRLLPRAVGGGVGGAFGVWGAHWRAEIRGQYFAPQPRDYPDVVVGGSFDLWTLGVAGCWVPTAGRLSFPLCGGVEVGSLRGRAESVSQPSHAGSFFTGLMSDASLVFAPIPRVGVRAGLGAVLSLRRASFHVRDQGTLFQAGYGAVRGSLGVEVRFL